MWIYFICHLFIVHFPHWKGKDFACLSLYPPKLVVIPSTEQACNKCLWCKQKKKWINWQGEFLEPSTIWTQTQTGTALSASVQAELAGTEPRSLAGPWVKSWGKPRWTPVLAPGPLMFLLSGRILLHFYLPKEPCPVLHPNLSPLPGCSHSPTLQPLFTALMWSLLEFFFLVYSCLSHEIQSTSRGGTMIKPLCVQ